MYWSVRNYVFKSSAYGWLLYVGNSGSLLSVSEEIAKGISLFRNGDFSSLSKETLKQFELFGAIIKETDEELLNILIMKSMKLKTSNENFFLTFCPANSCNFNCVYCFERKSIKNNGPRQFITKQTIINTVSYIKSRNIKNIFVSIFGGEPLLNIYAISFLDENLRKQNFNVSYDITTNAYLLNKDNIDKLAKLPIRQYNITIDGFEEIHNLRRPHNKNGDSYSTIIQNLHSFVAYYKYKRINHPLVYIRVNIDKANVSSYKNFFYHLKDMFPSFSIYSGFVSDRNNDNIPNLLSPREQLNFVFKNYENNIMDRTFRLNTDFKLSFCMADIQNSLVVDSDGFAYKCHCDLGKKNMALLNINEPKIINELLEAELFFKSSPLFSKKCKFCFLLFTCFGGCPRTFLNTKKRDCILMKYNPNHYFEIFYELLAANRKL